MIVWTFDVTTTKEHSSRPLTIFFSRRCHAMTSRWFIWLKHYKLALLSPQLVKIFNHIWIKLWCLVRYYHTCSWLSLKEEFEDTKGVIRSRKSKDRQYNDQKKKDKRTNNDLQNTTRKTKDRTTRTLLKLKVWYTHVHVVAKFIYIKSI